MVIYYFFQILHITPSRFSEIKLIDNLMPSARYLHKHVEWVPKLWYE